MLWNLDQSADIMKWYREFIVEAPEQLNGFFAFLTVPAGTALPGSICIFRKMCGIVWCHTGDERKQANEATRAAAQGCPGPRPSSSSFAPMPLPTLQRHVRQRALSTPGLAVVLESGLHERTRRRGDRACMSSMVRRCRLVALHRCTSLSRSTASAHGVPQNDGHAVELSHDATWSSVIVGVDPDPANTDRILPPGLREYWEALHPYGAGRAYVSTS